MTWYDLTVVIHVVGAAIGVGAATSSDWLFLHSIRDRVITSEQYNFLNRVSHVVMAGLAIVVLSGVAIVLQNGEVFGYPSFLAKMFFVFLLIINGFVFHVVLLRFLRDHRDERLTDETLANRLWLFATTGALSVVSWYGALLIGAMDPLQISIWLLLGIYFGVIVGAAVVAYLLLSHLIFSPMARSSTPSEFSAKERYEAEHVRFSWSKILLALLFTFFVGGLAVAFFRAGYSLALGPS
jgi:hypothetical protein